MSPEGCRHINAADVVALSELAGLTPAEWLEIAAVTPIEPLTPEEWRAAMLSVVEEGPDALDT